MTINLYNVFAIAFKLTQALYGKQPSVISSLKKIPFNPDIFDKSGRRLSDGLSFRNLVKEFERDFHRIHSMEYALNLYGNSQTMNLLARSCDAAPFMIYGMELTQGKSFDAEKDPYINVILK